MGSLNRREALEVIGVGVGAAVIASQYPLSTMIEWVDRFWRPEPERRPISPNSCLVGFAPDKNLSKNAYAMSQNMDITPGTVNYFMSNIDDRSLSSISADIDWCLDNGIVPMVSWGPKTNDIFGAVVRQDLTRLATLFSQKGPILFRPYFESNLSGCFSWNEPNVTAANFKKIWKEMYSLIKNDAPETKIIFAANTTDGDTLPIEAVFPGTEYMDLTGLDAYNKYSPNVFQAEHYLHPDVGPRNLIGPDLATLMTLTPGMPPPIITELNIMCQNRCAWLEQALEYSYSAGVRLVNFFQWDKHDQGIGETNWSFSNAVEKELALHFKNTGWYIRRHAAGVEGANLIMRYICA